MIVNLDGKTLDLDVLLKDVLSVVKTEKIDRDTYQEVGTARIYSITCNYLDPTKALVLPCRNEKERNDLFNLIRYVQKPITLLEALVIEREKFK